MPGIVPNEAGAGRNGLNEDSGKASAVAGGGTKRSRGVLRILLSSAALFALPAAAIAQQNGFGLPTANLSVGALEVIQFAVFAGVTGAALLSAIWLIRQRGRTEAENIEFRSQVAELGAALQRAETMLNLDDQRCIVWRKGESRPEIAGRLPAEAGVPHDRGAFLAFGRWLDARSAAGLEHALAELRQNARHFDLPVETRSGALLEAQGRTTPSGQLIRFVSLSAAQREHQRLRLEARRAAEERDTLLKLADTLDAPFWLRDAEGRLSWVNRAYAAAVDVATSEEAISQGREFLGTQARERIVRSQLANVDFKDKLSTVVGGDRRQFAVADVRGTALSAGMAVDLSEIEAVRAEYEHTVRSHADTLDQLNTAVAIFDTERKLRYFNHAFQALWELDPAFLESAPEHALVLDRLRSDGKLAEQPEWRRWKEQLLSAYRAVDPQEHWWHLPDGRTVRVVANPQPRGGVTWVFENLTEKIDLESRYNTAIKVQGETLDNLAEGVAVFGPDGRVRLVNPAFTVLWNIDSELVRTDTHISIIRAACRDMTSDGIWDDFVAAATGFDDERRDRGGQVELRNGVVLRYAVIHLPNGQAMMTFVDVTDSVNVERALKDKNEALQQADQLKNDFVQHVSYELRSPLTNIIGFTELMALEQTGPLNARQREYVDHIGSSSAVLLTIVNDILDLATVDAGIMELEIGEVPVGETVEAAAGLIAERFREHDIRLVVDTAQAPPTIHADGQRLRQVLFNLLSNAANYAPEGSEVSLVARRTSDGVEFVVHDDGPGMPSDMVESVFRRFEPRTNGGRRRGAGLGLSIVKSFVELHGGSVGIRSGDGIGTTVTCRFPHAPSGMRVAAE